MDAHDHKDEKNASGEKGGSCSKGECCSKSSCCKIAAVIGLLALGGLGGYIGGRYCATGVCPISGTNAPQQPAK